VEFRFGVSYSDNVKVVEAENLEEALELFCSTVDEPEEAGGQERYLRQDHTTHPSTR